MSDNAGADTQDKQSSRSSGAKSSKNADQSTEQQQDQATSTSSAEPTTSGAGPEASGQTDQDQTQAPQLPAVGLDHIKTRLGTDINAYGLELARRVLGELYIAALGGAPASEVAQEAEGQLKDGDASFWNEKGKELARDEFRGLNHRGSMIGVPDTDVPENPPEIVAEARAAAGLGPPAMQAPATGQPREAPAAGGGTA